MIGSNGLGLGTGLLTMCPLSVCFDRNGLIRVIVCAAIYSGLMGSGTVAVAQGAAIQSNSPALIHVLEGMRFVGPLAVDGEANPSDDALSFQDEKFTSQTCLKYGFAPALYWVRKSSEGLHFRADLQSPENGTIRFEGVFDGSQLRAVGHWTKKRWYWTVEQEIKFEGQPSALDRRR